MTRWGSRSKRVASGGADRALRVTIAVVLTVALMLSVSLVAVGCGGDTAQEKVVRQFLAAMENKDIKAVMSLMPPATMEQLEMMAEMTSMDVDDIIASFGDEMFPFDSAKFTDVTMETTETGEGTAIVQITGGTATITVDGVTEVNTVSEADFPDALPMVEVDGQWYLDFESME